MHSFSSASPLANVHISSLGVNPKTSNFIQKYHPFIGNLDSETSGDSNKAFLHCGDVFDMSDLCPADKGSYQRVGEATELALRVLTEKIGLLGYGSQALDSLSRAERVTYCNDHWQNDYRKVCKLFPLFSCAFVFQSKASNLSLNHQAPCVVQTHATTMLCKECECQSDRRLLFLHCSVRQAASVLLDVAHAL